MLEAVVFDFDGVIADSEPVHYAAIREVAATVGVAIDPDDYDRVFIGFDDRDAFREVLRRANGGVDEARVAAMCADKAERFDRLAEAGVAAIDGAIELADALRDANVPIAIGSGATHREIDLMLRGIGAADRFEVIVSADDVTHSKPDPMTYAAAVRRLGEAVGRALDPARCVAIEDTAAGVASAKAAGLGCVGVTTTGSAENLAQADRVVSGPIAIDLALLRAVAG
ncbi:MAG: HAD family phosphatase [Planctomycetota bacterium]